MANPFRCVLCQVYGDFIEGLRLLDLEHNSTAALHGFAGSSDTTYDFPGLTKVWKRLIRAERARQKAEVKEEVLV